MAGIAAWCANAHATTTLESAFWVKRTAALNRLKLHTTWLSAAHTKTNSLLVVQSCFLFGLYLSWSCILYLFCSIIGLETNCIQTMLMAQGATTTSNALSKTSVLQALQQQTKQIFMCLIILLVRCVPVVPMFSWVYQDFAN